MSVVLIAYHFPPDPAVGSLRAAKVARAFRAAGHRVHVVTACLPDEARTRYSDDPDLVIHPVTPLPGPRDVVAGLKRSMTGRRRSRHRVEATGGTEWVPPTRLPYWKRLLFALLWLPDDRQGFVLPALRVAWRLVRDGSRLVYSTAPPYSGHLVGLTLKACLDAKWIMELRDPWAGNDQKPWWVRTRPTDAVDGVLERLCLRQADLVVTVSEGIRARLAARLAHRERSRLLVVRNGIEHLASAALPPKLSRPVRIVYAGSFYYDRDPRPFLRGLGAARHTLGLGLDQIRVDFIGACRSIGGVSVEAEIERLGLSEVVHIRDWLPHEEARALIDQADVLLLLAQRQPDQVPNKLYEYLGARRRILAFADPDGETARMLRRVGGHLLVPDESEAGVARALEQVLDEALRGESTRTDESVLKEWTTEAEMKRLLVSVYG
jgi:hypothetical protein